MARSRNSASLAFLTCRESFASLRGEFPPPPSDFRADYSCASNSLTDAEAQYADAR